jgi:transcriptional regulator with XRE-family HTH domain
MRFTEIGQQLRAYRLESGLRAEEIAARLGVSRAALYRYEKGEVIKLDTVNRLAELLKISPLSLLGIGVEYYNRPIGFFERLRQLEETADQILEVSGPLGYLFSTDALDQALADIFVELAEQAGSSRAAARTQADQVLGILGERKRMYQMRRPGIISVVSEPALARLLEQGLGMGAPLSDRLAARGRAVARGEIENLAQLIETEPMGLQLGVLPGAEPAGTFHVLRARDRASVAMNPFRVDAVPHAQAGVAMITGAEEAVTAHQRVAEALWRDALKGGAAVQRLRQMLGRDAAP